MRYLAGLLLAICLSIPIGCSGKQRSIVGTWSFDRVSSGADAATRFKADGTWEDWFRGTNTKNTINTTGRGTYKLNGSRLTMTTLETTLTSGQVNKKNEKNTTTLRWLSEDQFELIMPDGSGYSYTRRPE